VEHNQQVNWEEVTKAKETNTRKKNIHEVAVMQIEGNVISQSKV
jgi:hypothetical protein